MNRYHYITVTYYTIRGSADAGSDDDDGDDGWLFA